MPETGLNDGKFINISVVPYVLIFLGFALSLLIVLLMVSVSPSQKLFYPMLNGMLLGLVLIVVLVQIPNLINLLLSNQMVAIALYQEHTVGSVHG